MYAWFSMELYGGLVEIGFPCYKIVSTVQLLMIFFSSHLTIHLTRCISFPSILNWLKNVQTKLCFKSVTCQSIIGCSCWSIFISNRGGFSKPCSPSRSEDVPLSKRWKWSCTLERRRWTIQRSNMSFLMLLTTQAEYSFRTILFDIPS